MAGVMLGAQSSLPRYFKDGGESKLNPTVVSFERELAQVLSSLKKTEKKPPCWEFNQRVSNALFNVWNSYAGKLPAAFYTAQLLATGDLLYKKGFYRLAKVHCYGRYLSSSGVDWNDDLVEHLRDTNIKDISSTLRATIGDVICQFYLAEERDPTMTLVSTRKTTLSVLKKLQQVSQVALSREPLYWLVYNALVLIYSLSRSLMSHGFSPLVLEYLLWAAVCMESSVPLMALKYLQLRVNFYVAACQCYWDARQPHHAELFARRGLDKVHELAQLEHQSSAEATESSALVFKEASIKMGVLVFRRSVLESRKKTKSVFRPKVRPTIRDLLQIPSPRSPTEKLLFEMFSGASGQFLAVLECLSDSSKRPLDRASPSPITELDNDTVMDVYQELFCIGVELSLRALEEAQRLLSGAPPPTDGADPSSLQSAPSLMSFATKGAGRIPLHAVVQFVRLARSNSQKEVVEILADPVIQVTKRSEDTQARFRAQALELILAIDSLRSAHKKYKVRIAAAQGGPPSSLSGSVGVAGHAPSPPHPPPTAGTTTTTTTTTNAAAGSAGQQTLSSTSDEGGTVEELFERLQNVLNLLHSSCVTNSSDLPPLVTMDYDLLLDTLVIVWEIAKPALARINSHTFSTCRQFLTHSTGKQYLELLIQLVEVAHSLELWQTDAQLHGELRLKLACLYEAKAELRNEKRVSMATSVAALEEGLTQLYDRQQLLVCLQELELGLECVERARAQTMEENRGGGEKDGGEEIRVLHSEYVYAIMRVKVKLASTIPPPPPPESTQKPSSLKSKVRERQERQRQRERMLSELTAPTVAVDNEAQLREAAGKNLWSSALLLMLQASTAPRLTQEDRDTMMKESFSYLLQEQQRLSDLEKMADGTNPRTPLSSPSPSLLPPPLLLCCTSRSMTFVPQPFADPKLQDKVTYYRLFGRIATGSNIKVRLTDKNLPGLGVAVPACGSRDTTLKVKGLQANESYVFAVTAYGATGEVVGGAIGLTGRPIVACYPLPMLMLWGHCCQCAYLAGVEDVASKASAVLWKKFVHQPPQPSSVLKETQKHNICENEEQLHLHSLDANLLSTMPTAILRHFVQSVIIDVQLSMVEASLYSNQLCTAGPLKHSQLLRFSLVCKLFSVVQVSGTINDSTLCLQAVVLCLGLLSPLIQHNVTSRPLMDALLYCHSVLTELPEHVLVSKDSSSTASLHHLIGSTALHVGKVVTAAQRKSLFTSFTNNARGLLLSTMQAATNVAKEMEKEVDKRGGAKEKEAMPPPADGDLQQQSVLSESQDASLVSYATVRSALGNILPQKGTDKKKKGRKKLMAAADQLSDESKSVEYKAFEAFLMSSQSHQGVEDLDLTGQEDPVILHAVVVHLPSQLAYKEVHKFRRRPQYLEFLVHLCGLTLAKGGQEKVMSWIQEAFHWLKKRNEIVLMPKPSQPKIGVGGGVGHTHHQKGRVASARGSTTALVQTKANRRTSLTGLAPSTAIKGPGLAAKDSKIVLSTVKEDQHLSKAASKALLTVTSQHASGSQKTQQIARRPSAMAGAGGKRLLPAASRMLDASLSVKITRDDIEFKAHSLVATLLPELWRKHKCRKRLRVVCSEELPWRSQANLIMATCHLDVLLGRLGVGQVVTDAEPHLYQPPGLTFDTAGVIIEGVLPTHPPVMAGARATTKPQGKGVGGGKLLNSMEAVTINDIQLVMGHLQRSIVLAWRGRHWTLLQNSARSLWNTINTLLQATNTSYTGGSKRDTVLGAVYGHALQSLFFTARGLVEMLETMKVGDGSGDVADVPCVASLHFTKSLDDCNSVGMAFIKQVVFLAVHVLYAHKHWEKVIDVAVRFDDITNHSWADQLVPVICSAQSKLAHRLAQHSEEMATSQEEKLQPAAHLDPGPDGYNVYGKMGHSLAITSVPLDTKAMLKRASNRQSRDENEIALSKARSLLARYTAAQFSQKIRDGRGGDDADSADDELLACPSAPVVQVSIVVSAYDEAIAKLLDLGKRDGAAQAMSEMGDVMWHCGQIKASSHWWKEALATVTMIQAPPSGWRKALLQSESVLTEFGVWGCLLSAVNAAKLARYTCPGALDVRLEYALLSASLFKALLTFSLPHPVEDLDYISYQLPQSSTGAQLTPGLELFSDTHRCNPLAVMTSLSWVAKELIHCHHYVKVLPVLWLYQHMAQKVCRDVAHTVFSKLLKLKAMTQLCFFDQALLLLSDLLTGAALPSTTTDHPRLLESHWSPLKFNIGAPLGEARNVKCLQQVIEKGLSNKLKQLYGHKLVCWIGLARAQLYTSLANTGTHVTAPISSRSGAAGKSTAVRPPTNLSTITASPRSSAPSSPGAVRPAENNSTLAKRIKSDIKLALLDRAEKEIISVCNELASLSCPELQARSYLSMAEVALALYQPSVGTQLSLASLRCLQTTEKVANLSGDSEEIERTVKLTSLSEQGSSSADLRLWLKCRSVLAKSLVSSGHVWLKCDEVCGDGCEESEACGDIEKWAEFHLMAAMHALSMEPPNLDLIQTHTQTGLELLNSLHDQSPHAQLLCCKLSLVLSDVSCLTAGQLPTEMVQVFHGLAEMLNNQMADLSNRSALVNMYHPQRVLLASSKLRLAHTLMLMAVNHSPSSADDRGTLISSAVTACQDGLQLLKDSAHSNQLLEAELNFHYGLLCASQTDDSGGCNFSPLLEAAKLISSLGVDYRLSFTTFYELAQLYSASSKRPKPSFKLSKMPIRGDSPSSLPRSQTPSSAADQEQSQAAVSQPHRRGSRAGILVQPSTQEQERASKAEREWHKERARESYLAWCMLKSALQCHNASQQLRALSSELHNEEVTKPLTDKVLDDLPDFALLDLCPMENPLDLLAMEEGVVPPPIEMMLPSAQHTDMTGLTWFKIIRYFCKLLNACFWQKNSLDVISSTCSPWMLHYSERSPSTYSKCKALLLFLSQHCPPFKSCRLPSVPPVVSLSSTAQRPSGGAQSAAGGQQADAHLTAADNELTVVWAKPYPSVSTPFPSALAADGKVKDQNEMEKDKEKTSKADDDDEEIIGIFAFNQRAVRSALPPNLSSFGFESYTVRTTTGKLSRLHKVWQELTAASNSVLVESRSSTRPISRSPSKQKRMEKPFKVPSELVESLEAAAIDLAGALGSKLTKELIPKLELQNVGVVAQVLEPFGEVTIKGEVFHFFKGLFNPTE